MLSAWTPIPQEGDVFDVAGRLSSVSHGVSLLLHVKDSACGSKAKRGQTQHGRRAGGLERSVQYNEWDKGNNFALVDLHCCRRMSGFVVCFRALQYAFSFLVLFCLAGMTEVPTGAVCLSSRQILAYGKAAVRLERSQSQVEEKSLSRHKFFLYTVIACLFDCSLDCVWSFVFVALCSVLCLSVTLFGVRLLFFFVLFRYERSRAIVEVKRHSAASGFRATR